MITDSQEKFKEIYQQATRSFQAAPDWVTYFRQVLGVDGLIRRELPSTEKLAEFEQSPEYEAIQQMLVKLRERNTPANEEEEPTRVITVRLPKSLHETLRIEAHEHRTSMNKLCISKLLQVIDEELVPSGQSNKSASKAGTSRDSVPSRNSVPSPSPVAQSSPVTQGNGMPPS